jgi:hypothetical protein
MKGPKDKQDWWTMHTRKRVVVVYQRLWINSPCNLLALYPSHLRLTIVQERLFDLCNEVNMDND